MIENTNIPQKQVCPGWDTSRVKPFVMYRMRYWFVWMATLLMAETASAQFGVNVQYLFGRSALLDEQEISQNGIQAKAEYHFRLKQKRLEFHPGIGYRFAFNSSSHTGYLEATDIDLTTTIYPFDFAGDCHCPTFSKQGTTMKKGFFLEFIPGMGTQVLNRVRTEPDNPSVLPIRSKKLVLKLGIAAGLDIGISDYFTLSPLLSATWISPEDFNGLYLDGSAGKLDDFMYFGAGIRFTYTSEAAARK